MKKENLSAISFPVRFSKPYSFSLIRIIPDTSSLNRYMFLNTGLISSDLMPGSSSPESEISEARLVKKSVRQAPNRVRCFSAVLLSNTPILVQAFSMSHPDVPPIPVSNTSSALTKHPGSKKWGSIVNVYCFPASLAVLQKTRYICFFSVSHSLLYLSELKRNIRSNRA